MNSMEVVFEVPAAIQAGLASGTLERVGGVIRDTQSKAITSWLREGSSLSQAANVPIWGSATQVISLLNTGGMLLNLGVSTASLVIIMQRLDKLTNAIDALEETIRSEFKRDRDRGFTSALESARDALEASNKDNRSNQARTAIKGLYEAQIDFLEDFDNTFKSNPLLAQHSLVRAMYASNSRIRCYLEVDEIDLAKTRLREDRQKFKHRSKQLIKSWMGEHPAKFLHHHVTDSDVNRFIQIQHFLKGSDVSDAQGLMNIIHELRADFWNQEAIEDAHRYIGPIRRVEQSFEDQVKTFPEKLLQAETLIENYQRLQSFEMELRYLKLSNTSFMEWSNRVTSQEIQAKGASIAMLIPDQPIPLDTVA